MSARQLYRQPRTPEQIVAELYAQRGAQWDPGLVDLVLALIDSGELQLGADGLRLLEHAAGGPSLPATAILLVEDDDEHARLVVQTLEEALGDTIVARARSAADAAELLTGSTWALAISTVSCPTGTGSTSSTRSAHTIPPSPSCC